MLKLHGKIPLKSQINRYLEIAALEISLFPSQIDELGKINTQLSFADSRNDDDTALSVIRK